MRVCCVPGCTTRRLPVIQKEVDDGFKPISLFAVPKNPNLLERWKEVIPITNRNKVLASKYHVCALHFKNEDIDSTFKIVINGQALFPDKYTLRLKPNVCPSLRIGRFNPLNRNQHKTLKLNVLKGGKKREQNNPSQALASTPKFSFEMLQNTCSQVELPSSLWALHQDPHGKCIAFSYFSPDKMMIEKTVVISETFEPAVLFGGRSSVAAGLECPKPNSVQDISLFIKGIDEINVCVGTSLEPKYSPKCPGYVYANKRQNKSQCGECVRFKSYTVSYRNAPFKRGQSTKKRSGIIKKAVIHLNTLSSMRTDEDAEEPCYPYIKEECDYSD